jgi:hypothetical protein
MHSCIWFLLRILLYLWRSGYLPSRVQIFCFSALLARRIAVHGQPIRGALSTHTQASWPSAKSTVMTQLTRIPVLAHIA